MDECNALHPTGGRHERRPRRRKSATAARRSRRGAGARTAGRGSRRGRTSRAAGALRRPAAGPRLRVDLVAGAVEQLARVRPRDGARRAAQHASQLADALVAGHLENARPGTTPVTILDDRVVVVGERRDLRQVVGVMELYGGAEVRRAA